MLRRNINLNEEQMRTIEGSISHLLEFSDDPKTFAAEEAGLVNALTKPVEKGNPLYWLRECFLHPEEHFQNLSRIGPKLNVGEIQAYIIDLIDTALAKTKQPLRAWDKSKALTLIPSSHFTTAFVSKMAPVDGGENPWQLSQPQGKVYTQELRIKEEKEVIQPEEDAFDDPWEGLDEPIEIIHQSVHVQVTIRLPGQPPKTKTVKLADINSNFATVAAENMFMDSQKAPAEREAKNAAAEVVITALSSKLKLQANLTRQARNSNSAKEVITHEYYYGLLSEGKLAFNAILNLTERQAACLCHPTIIALLKKNLLSIDKAKELTPDDMRVITHNCYFDLLNKGVLTVQQITGISERRSKFMVHPSVTGLIQRGKLSYSQARDLPIYLKDILFSDLYFTFFINNDTDWILLGKIPEGHHLALLNKNIARFVGNGILPINKIVEQSQGISDPSHTLFYFYIYAFATRLYWLANKHPWIIDSKPDDMKSLLDEITHAAGECQSNFNLFNEWIASTLINYLQFEINHRIEEAKKVNIETDIYESMLKLITPTDLTAVNWSAMLSSLVHQCQLTLRVKRFVHNYADETPYLSKTFFSHLNEQDDDLTPQKSSNKKMKIASVDTDALDFCAGLIGLKPLTDSTQLQPAFTFNFTF